MNVRELINKWVILGALGVAGLLLLITAVTIGLTSARQPSDVGVAPADVTVIVSSDRATVRRTGEKDEEYASVSEAVQAL